MSKNINDLRDSMFQTLSDLREGKITVEQAKAMSDIGQVIINSAKVEVDHIRARGGDGQSEFIGFDDPAGPAPDGVTRIVRHRLAG